MWVLTALMTAVGVVTVGGLVTAAIVMSMAGALP